MVAVKRVIDDGLPEPPRKPGFTKPKRPPRYEGVQHQNFLRRKEMLKLCMKGYSTREAYEAVGRGLSWYSKQRLEHPDWALEISRAGGKVRQPMRDAAGVIDVSSEPETRFPEFCEKYLGQRLFPHQLQWWDILEGREPRDLHPSMTFDKGDQDFMMINVPPHHAKSTTITCNWVVYQICMNPNIRITVISKTQTFAETFCYAVQQRLTHPRYRELQRDFGPVGGWQATADKWTKNRLYLGGEARDSGEKDPTLQCIGIGNQIYGTRGDWYLVDDAIVSDNAHEFEKQIRWLQQDVVTRPGYGSGRMVVIGTRVSNPDLYSELRNPDRYSDGVSPWTYLSQPAVLEFADKPENWVTLWPRSNEPWSNSRIEPVRGADGLYQRWDGPALHRQRGLVGARTWSFAYQQQNHSEEAVFPRELVLRSVKGMRSPGLMHAGAVGYRPKGMDGLYVVCGVDPAMAGDTAFVVMGLDRFSGIRYVLDARMRTAASPTWIRETIKDLAVSLKVNEFRIEKNAFQIMLTQDPELHRFLAERGITIVEHFTGKNKWDSDYGVAAMSLLFQNNLIELPNLAKSEALKQLVEQLTAWAPQLPKQVKTDLVMATWFAEIKCREIMQATTAGELVRGFLPNRFLSRRRRANQFSVNITDLASSAEVG